MKRNKFYAIVVLMSISLLGIIAVQILWMYKAVTIKEEQFNRQVSQALSRASQRIERNQNAHFVSSFFTGMNFGSMQQAMAGKMFADDSAFMEFADFWQEQTSTINKSNELKHNRRVERKNKDGIETIEYSFDTVIQQGASTHIIQSYSRVVNSNKDLISNNEIKKGKEGADDDFGNVMNQMLLEFSLRNMPIDKRLSYSIIEPTIEYELTNVNIPLKFEYAIANSKGELYDKLKTKGFRREKANYIYKTTLFPNDILTPSDKLLIYFPERRNYLLNSLLWPLIGSLFFTFIILFTFYYTLRIIFNQKKVSEVKTDFINNMTHEFKTPIATISLAADAISNPVVLNSPDKVTHFINVIKEENKRMNRQVESVLKMALIDKKDFNLNMQVINVHPVIEQAVRNISIQVEQKGGDIKMELKAEVDEINVDENHFANIVYNLLDNAIKYSLKTPPDITVETFIVNGLFNLSVSDKGIGMDKETLDKIFDKFYRVPTGNVHTVKGFGLGLSYVKAIVGQFKGDITVKSHKDKGSVFTVILPLVRRVNTE